MNVFAYIKPHGSDGIQALALDADKLTNKKHFKLLDEGWEHVIDNVFPNLQVVYDYMEQGVVNEKNEEVHAYQDYCRRCGWFAPVSHVTGRVWSFRHEKEIIFNGKACEQCVQDFVSIKHSTGNITPAELERIQQRAWLEEVNRNKRKTQ